MRLPLCPGLTKVALGLSMSLAISLAMVLTMFASPVVASGGRVEPFRISVGGQDGWQHDEGNASGYFNTFDAIDVAGQMRRPRKIHVYLPRSYVSGARRYPVAYFNDGTTAFFANGGPTMNLAQVMDDLYRQGALSETILVGVNPTDRDKEYTYAPVPTKNTCCELEAYAGYLAEQLKPFIDANYRTVADAKHTAIIGSSHGGLAAFVTAALYPQSFGLAGCLSSSFWVDMTPFGPDRSLRDSVLVRRLAEKLHAEGRPRLWLDWGLVRLGGSQNSLIEANAATRSRELATILTSDFGYRLNDTLRTMEDPQGGHDEASWSRRLRQILPWLFTSGVR